IVQSQILIAEGHSLHGERVQIPKQEDLTMNGYAIQSRVTTEDPLNDFMPDTGKIMVYRSGGGFGVRLDAGNGFQGAVITPHYDSLLVKVSTQALTFRQAASKMVRTLKEFRIRGIKTNIPFLINVMEHEQFITGEYDTSFLDSTPELFAFPESRDRGTKLLKYIGTVTLNGFPGIEKTKKPVESEPRIPSIPVDHKIQPGTKQILDERGADGLA
ncbi:pyruvate carboxylase, partial [Siminovitchia sediminis]